MHKMGHDHLHSSQNFSLHLPASTFKSAMGRQFSRLLAAEVCASAVVMLDTPCSYVVRRVLATHSIRQFLLHFPSRAQVRHFKAGETLSSRYVSSRDVTSAVGIFNIEFWRTLTLLSLCIRHMIWRGALVGSHASTPVKFLLSHTFREKWWGLRHMIWRGAVVGSHASTLLKFLLSHTFRETWRSLRHVIWRGLRHVMWRGALVGSPRFLNPPGINF
jgi:hypothetical protein